MGTWQNNRTSSNAPIPPPALPPSCEQPLVRTTPTCFRNFCSFTVVLARGWGGGCTRGNFSPTLESLEGMMGLCLEAYAPCSLQMSHNQHIHELDHTRQDCVLQW